MNPWQAYADIFREENKPFAFVDLDAFERNFADLRARCGGKKIRVATKSLRCVELMRRLAANDQVCGWMCFSADEAVHLAAQGFDHLLVAYPTLQAAAVRAVCAAVRDGKNITLMCDSIAHLQALNAIAAAEHTVLPIALDVDVSMRLPGIYFGVYRSSLHDMAALENIITALPDYPQLKLDGIMTYEAQIAGVIDRNPYRNPLYNAAIALLKKRSIARISARRQEIAALLQRHRIELAFFNGGGTGSLETTVQDAAVSEVTFGSGLYASGLFDHYHNFRHRPAAGFVLEVVRQPQAQVYTALGGGYIASGAPGQEKLPQMVYPADARLIKDEGAGEVQTPFRCNSALDWPQDNFVVMRHAKAGELCERFNELLLLQNGAITARVPTYRGMGWCFL
ncbi:MAG: alanine racemase [Neisseria sp.]|nr:alanine racemase [Neisseria sp.]